MFNNVDYIITMVREREHGRSGNNVVVAHEVVKTLKMDISCFMRDFNNKMVVATLGTMAIMPSLNLALNGKKAKEKLILLILDFTRLRANRRRYATYRRNANLRGGTNNFRRY